jgi:hypothetical protein
MQSTTPLTLGDTLILFMTPNQQRMLERFGEIVGVDATYKVVMWGLPFFIVCVVNAQGVAYPAAYFFVSAETKVGIAEVLVHMKHITPKWNPGAFIVDKSDAEIGAIQMVYGQRMHIILCDFHVKQAFTRWVKTSVHNIGDVAEKKRAYDLMAAMADSTTFDRLAAAEQSWEDYMEHSENPALVGWFQNEWMPIKSMWCKVYRADIFTRGFNTNNPNEAINKAVKGYAQGRWDFKVCSLVKELLDTITGIFDLKHAESQVRDTTRKSTKALEVFEAKTKVDARKLISKKAATELMNRMKASNNIDLDTVQVRKE